MAARLPQLSRLVQGDHSGTCKRLIGSRFTAVLEGVVVFGVWDSSMAAAAGPKPKDTTTKRCWRFNGEWLQQLL